MIHPDQSVVEMVVASTPIGAFPILCQIRLIRQIRWIQLTSQAWLTVYCKLFCVSHSQLTI